MPFTYDLSTNIGKVRLLVPDNKAAAYVFDDDEITALLAVESSNVKRTAALALETIASNQAMVLKVITILDLSTNGAAVSDALLKRAAQLRAQADDEDAGTAGGAFDWAEMVTNDFSYRERIDAEALRDG